MVRIFYVLTGGDSQVKQETEDKIRSWVQNYRIFTNIVVTAVVVPPESLVNHNARIKQRNSYGGELDNKNSLDVLFEIENQQIPSAQQLQD